MSSINEALDWLYQQKKLKRREDLSRIKECIKLLHIHTSYPIIHIAGTNGKGSTAKYLNQMLILAGKRVGLFVSPFVVCFNERIEINNEYIKDEEIVSYIQILKQFQEDYQKEYQDTIPFFELTLLMALLHFEKNKIDILVLECGIGGLLDATNALPKEVAVITNIGYDHMSVLGPTLEDIAYQKLGITRKNIPCFTTVDESLLPYFKEYSLKHEFPLIHVKEDVSDILMLEVGTQFIYKNEVYQTHLSGFYQAYNAALAIAVIKYLFKDYPKNLIDTALAMTTWPGRFEYITPQIILDGAHNLPGIKALVESLKLKYKDKKIKVVFTALKDKAIDEMLASLDEVTEQYFFTTIADQRASELSFFHTKKKYQLFELYTEAIQSALDSLKEDEILVITGSLHFMSEVRSFFLET